MMEENEKPELKDELFGIQDSSYGTFN